MRRNAATTSTTYLVDRLDDPVDSGVSSDSLVRRIDKDDLEVLVCRILVDPVCVEDSQVGASLSDSFLSSRPERSLVLQLIDTLVGGLSCTSHRTLENALPFPHHTSALANIP